MCNKTLKICSASHFQVVKRWHNKHIITKVIIVMRFCTPYKNNKIKQRKYWSDNLLYYINYCINCENAANLNLYAMFAWVLLYIMAEWVMKNKLNVTMPKK